MSPLLRHNICEYHNAARGWGGWVVVVVGGQGRKRNYVTLLHHNICTFAYLDTHVGTIMRETVSPHLRYNLCASHMLKHM